MAKQKTYIAIDLKSFYASVECKERNRDPLTTNLVVADKSRTEKTICLAVSPSLKSYGIPGRPRLFEVVQKVKEANNNRRWKAPNRTFTGSSDDSTELNANPALEIDYIVAPPRMATIRTNIPIDFHSHESSYIHLIFCFLNHILYFSTPCVHLSVHYGLWLSLPPEDSFLSRWHSSQTSFLS